MTDVGSPPFNLADLWEATADTVPDRTAVVCGDRRLTYGELDERANRLAATCGPTGSAPVTTSAST